MEGDVYIPQTAPADADLDLFFRAEALKAMLLEDPRAIDASLWDVSPDVWQAMSIDEQLDFAVGNTIRDEKAMELAGIDPDNWVEMPLKERSKIRRFYAID